MSRSAWAGLIGLAVLAAALWGFLGRDRGVEPDGVESLGLPDGEPSAIELRGSGPFRLEREGDDGWRLTEPGDAEADPRAVEEHLLRVSRLAVVRRFPAGTLTEETEDAFGFRAESSSLTFEFADRSVRWRLGGVSPVGGERYLDRDGELLLVESSVAEDLFVDPIRLRQRHLCPDAADGLLAVDRSDPGGWGLRFDGDASATLSSPVNERVDPDAVDALRRAVRSLRVESFLDGLAPAELEPAVSVTLASGGSDDDAVACEFRVSRRVDPEGLRAACRADATLCGSFESETLEVWFRDPDDWRDRRVLSVSTPDVAEVVFEDEHGRRRFVRGPDGWSDATGKPVPGDWIERVVASTRSWRAVGFDAPPIESSRRRVLFVRDGDAEPVVVGYGRNSDRCIVEDMFSRRVEVECEAVEALPWTEPEPAGSGTP